MGEGKRRRAIEAATDEITRRAVDKGMLIEAGWLGLKAACISPNAPQEQLHEMRMAFFAGAQHLYGSIMGFLEAGEEPTEADLQRMDLIDKELRAFIKDFELRHLPTEGTA